MAKKEHTLRIKPGRDCCNLWPKNAQGTTIYAGPVVVKFKSGKSGKSVVVVSRRHKVTRKVIDKRGG